MTERTLEVDSVIKTFGYKSLLTDVYLKCTTNEVLGILGRNGTGKSTLLRIIFGSTDADTASIRIDGQLCERAFSRGNLIACLPQHPFLPKHQSVGQIIRIFLKESKAREAVSTHFRIKPLLTKKIAGLSGGERRYLEVLLILNRPVPFVLLDEPFAAVEPLYRTEIKELIGAYRKEKGIILTDHDYVNVTDVCDQTYLIDSGVCRPIRERTELITYNYLPPDRSKDGPQEEAFTVDGQTLKDLGLEDINHPESLFSLFEKPATKGGKAFLEELFHSPTRNRQTLEDRQQSIRFLQENEGILAPDRKQLDFISFYLDSGVEIAPESLQDSLFSSLKNKYRVSNDFYIKETGIRSVCAFLKFMDRLSTTIQQMDPPSSLSFTAYTIQALVHKQGLRDFVNGFDSKLFFLNISRYDFLLRKKAKDVIARLLDLVYELEAYQSIGKTALRLNFTFPEYPDLQDACIEVEGLFHPQIQNAVPNSLYLSEKENLCFLTGANMAGKSSFLKAFGIAVYLAHLGIPVPATRMRIALFDGLITTINLSDSLNFGLSHFYSEVKRVREVANQLVNNRRLVVLFDELFRGTSVKDATTASSLIINAIARRRGSVYIISSHILEIAGDIAAHQNIFFRHFDTNLVDDKPVYTYQLKDGVAKESLGLNIVLREQIVELLEGKLPPPAEDL